MATLQSVLDKELDQNVMKKVVIELFNSRLLALEAQNTRLVELQSSTLEMVRELSNKALPREPDAPPLTEKELRLLDFARNLENS